MNVETLEAIKRHYKSVVAVVFVCGILVGSFFTAKGIIAHSYKSSDLFVDSDSSSDVSSAVTQEQIDIANGYDDVKPEAVSIDTDGVRIYGYNQDSWDYYHDDYINKVHMMGQYYESQLYSIQNDDPIDLTIEKTKYILSTELSPYLNVLNDGEYRVEEGEDKYGNTLYVVTFSFPDDIELSFEYKRTVSPTHIIKNKEFTDMEKEYFRWVTEPETGMVNILEDGGKWSIGR